MKTEIFKFNLPEDLIAQFPAEPRESANLLHIFKGQFVARKVGDLPDLLKAGDVLVLNDTKVIPARIYGKRGQASVELTLFKQLSLNTWQTMIKNSRRLKVADEIIFNYDLKGTVLKKYDIFVDVQFNVPAQRLFEILHQIGIMPLPPYIKRLKTGNVQDLKNYQPIFAKNEGAVAAPTASLHLTQNLLDTLKEKGVEFVFGTLHVGGGTFLPVKVDDTDQHVMHSEFGELSPEAAEKLNAAKKQGRRLIPVGTTALRLLESATDKNGVIHPFCGQTDIFIVPGYRFRATDALMTNFHLSGSTLFMLVCALAGIDTMKRAYRYAIDHHFRFFSYGDACFIEKNTD